ncbi:hypothetical protein [Dankookia sp. P2]|uniref:hypothetical protein n=1 Tax=Dankookia sp. P2 TaxID=3423955 RepID=UPI003D674011
MALVRPDSTDIHLVENALADAPSISIHCYGGNIGAVRRHAFDPVTGAAQDFISGYSADTVPNCGTAAPGSGARTFGGC